MLSKNDKIEIMHVSIYMMYFCHDASKTMKPILGHSETIQQTCKGLSNIFSLLEKEFETISKIIVKDFSKKEIKKMIESSKKGFKRHKQEDHLKLCVRE